MTIKDINFNGDEQLPINEFKLESMCENPSIVMVAKRGSGKSWVCRKILNHFKDIPCGLIIAPTDRTNCFYGNFIPESYIHDRYRSDIIEKLLYRQDQIIAKKKEKKIQGKKVDARAFIVMDDCLASKGTWMRDPPIQELFFNGRHSEIMYILTMQYPLGISPELRGNFDYIFILAEDYISNLKRIYDHYAGVFPDFNSFRQAFSQLTENFGCMVIANRGPRKNFLEKVFWYKATDVTNVTIGCKQFHKYHNNNYNPRWRDTNKLFDANKFFDKYKKNKRSMKVEKIGLDEKGNPIDKKETANRKRLVRNMR